jgi:hypothetical protein
VGKYTYVYGVFSELQRCIAVPARGSHTLEHQQSCSSSHNITARYLWSRTLGMVERWAWTQYRGRNNVSLRVVTANRPVRNTTGSTSVWNQQRSYFDGKDDDRCPRELFNLHLADAIRTWLAAGDQLVVALDANEDVRSGTVYQILLDLGLTKAIIDQHRPDGPSTFAHGSSPIDGLFVSSTLLGLRCGYTGYWHGHRCLWMDIPQSIAFGHDMPPIVRASAWRLKVEDPRVLSDTRPSSRPILTSMTSSPDHRHSNSRSPLHSPQNTLPNGNIWIPCVRPGC